MQIKYHRTQKRTRLLLDILAEARIREDCPIKIARRGASLVAQWLRICLPMQGTRVRALVWEDPTCRRAAGP